MELLKIDDYLYLAVWIVTTTDGEQSTPNTVVYLSEKEAYRTLIQWPGENLRCWGSGEQTAAAALFEDRSYVALETYVAKVIASDNALCSVEAELSRVCKMDRLSQTEWAALGKLMIQDEGDL